MGLFCHSCVIQVKLADFADAVELHRSSSSKHLHTESSEKQQQAQTPDEIRRNQLARQHDELNTFTSPPLSITGTKPYASPELDDGNVAFSFAADMWSIGILAVEMSNMALPFRATCDGQDVAFRPNQQSVFVPSYSTSKTSKHKNSSSSRSRRGRCLQAVGVGVCGSIGVSGCRRRRRSTFFSERQAV